jgi:hypothetical protein
MELDMALEQYLHGSYFSIENPLRLLDRWLNAYRHQCRVRLGEKELLVKWSARAEAALAHRSEPLIVEMQLYFSCVVKKRVVFHDAANFESLAVNDNLQIVFRPIQSARCDPQEFARNYPIGRVLDSPAAAKMQPAWVALDFRRGQWQGEFGY